MPNRERSDADREYDVALSFAGEDRRYVEQVASALRDAGVRVFYDQFEQVDLWGKDLYEHLDYVYRDAAKLCVLFASSSYAEKAWTTHERRSAQARVFSERSEYILPARFDETPIPGLLPTVGYIDLRSRKPAELAHMIEQKLSMLSAPPAPRLLDVLGLSTLDKADVSELRQLAAEQRPLSSALLGVDVNGESIWLPLVQSGPILALGGTTGSGKTELLRGLLLSLALTHRPEDLGMAFIDFRGGADNGELGSLPHTLQSWIPVEDEELRSICERLEAEFAARQAALDAGRKVPVLLLVVDEFDAVSGSYYGDSWFAEWLWNLMRRGRPLNVCAIVASQTWSRTVARLPPIVRLRVALRTARGTDSELLIGSRVADELPRGAPGAGWLVVGDPSDPIPFRAAYSGYDFSGTRSLIRHEMSFTRGETEFHALVQAVRDTAPRAKASWTQSADDRGGPSS